MPKSPQDLLKSVQTFFKIPPVTPTTTLATKPAPVFVPTPFQSNLSNIVGSALSKVASKVGGFAKESAGSLADTVTGKLKATPQDYLQGIKTVAYGLGNGVQAVSQGFNEGITRILKSASQATLGPNLTQKVAQSPAGDFAKVITGRSNLFPTGQPAPHADEPLLTYQDIHKKAQDFAVTNNATPHEASIFSGLAVVGAMFADNPLVSGEGGAFKLSAEAVENLAKDANEVSIAALLRKENKFLSPRELDVLVPVFKAAKTPEEVHLISQQVDKMLKHTTTAEHLAEDTGIPGKNTEIPAKPGLKGGVQGEPVEVPEFHRTLAEMNRRTPDGEPIADGSFSGRSGGYIEIPKEEISAEVKKQISDYKKEDIFLHPKHDVEVTTMPLSDFDGKTIRASQQTVDREGVAKYKKEIESGKRPAVLLEETAPGEYRIVDGHTRATAYQQLGVDEVPVIVRATSERSTTRSQFSPNLLKSLADSKDPADIAMVLQKEFPTLSEPAVASIARRIKVVSRTKDIEGVLKTVGQAVHDLKAPARALKRRAAKALKEGKAPGLAKAIKDIMDPEELDRYLESATRAINDPERSVLAQQEYQALWEAADQKVIDRMNDLLVQRDIYREHLDLHPGKGLSKYVSKTTGRLPEVTGKDTMESLTGSGKKVATSEFGRTGDQLAEDYGLSSVDEAQRAVEDYGAMREQLKAINDELKEIRPKARAAQILQTMQDEVPVVSRKDAGAMDQLADADRTRFDYRDISGFSAHGRDVYRNFKAFFGNHYNEVKKMLLDPFDKSKGDLIDEIHTMGDRVDDHVISKYGFKRGSKEDHAIMDYAEREITRNERVPGLDFENTTKDGLTRKFGAKKAEDIMAAAEWFRKEYDRLIDEANDVRATIYPNNPTKLIAKRKDYMRHFKEIGGDFKGLIDLFETPAGIDPQLAGISEFTKPMSKYLSFAQERIGQGSARSAIGGFLDYAPSFAYMKHIDPHIGKFRYLRRKLAEVAPTPGITEVVEQGSKKVTTRNKGINNFLEYLDDYAGDLAGKTNPADRYLQKIVPGGRKTLRAIDWTNSRVKSNQILGNLSSAVAQAFNLPQGIASAKLYNFPAIQRTLASIFLKNEPMEASAFLKERYATPLTSRFKLDMFAHPVRGSVERSKDAAAWVTQALDEVATKYIWNAHYLKGLGEGAADAVKYADDMTRSLVAGRGIGEVPLIQKAKWFKTIAPFTLEVGNSWWVMKDWVKQKDFGALATFFVASYLMNEAAAHVRGSRVVFDPINSLIEGSNSFMDEMHDSGDPYRASLKFAGRQFGEVLSNVPLGSTFAAALPDQFQVPFTNTQIQRKELFGEGDPGRYGNPLITLSALGDPLYKLVTPFGGAQIKKTTEAIEAMLKGQVKTPDGKLSYTLSHDPQTVVQALLFGKNATPEAQKAFDERDDIFQRIYRQDASRTQLSLDAEDAWANIKKIKQEKGGDAAAAELQRLVEKDPQLADKIVDIADDESQGLDGTDRLVKMLGVENGERAKFIVDQIKTMKTGEEKAAFIQHLAEKKLVSDDVIDQITTLLQGDKLDHVQSDKYLGTTGSYLPAENDTQAQGARDEALREFPFTDQARAELGNVTYGNIKGQTGNSTAKDGVKVQGLFNPKGADFQNFIIDHIGPFSPKAAKFILDHTEFLQNMDKANINLGTTDPEVVAHEMLHSLFDMSPISENKLAQNDPANIEALGNRFMETWEKDMEGDEDFVPTLREIDHHLQNNYDLDTMTPADIATERFAYLGEQVVKGGLDAIPPNLRPFYEQVFKFPKAKTGRK